MRREDRLFWAVLVGLVVVLVVAGIAVAARRGEVSPFATYLPDESRPEVVVHNAYVAAVQNDVDRFRSYFKRLPWRGGAELRGLYAYEVKAGQVHIGTPTISGDTARVPVMLVRQVGNGLFGGDIYVQEQTVTLVREDGRWVITSELPFVYPELEPVMIPAPPGGD